MNVLYDLAYRIYRSKKYTRAILGIFVIGAAVLCVSVLPKLFVPSSQQTLQIEHMKKQEVKSIVAQCSNKYGNWQWEWCYTNEMEKITKMHSLSYAIQLLLDLQKADPKTFNCHLLAHGMIAAELEKNPLQWKNILKHIDYNACSYGYIHGLIEGRSRYDKSFTISEKTIVEMCKLVDAKKIDTEMDMACSHAFGHVLLVATKGSVADAIHVCDQVPLSNRLQRGCTTGVFMESYIRDNLVLHGFGQYIPWDDQHIVLQEQLCNQYGNEAGMGCWIEMSFMYFYRHPYDPVALFADCGHAPRADYKRECYIHGLIALTMKENPSKEYFQSLCKPFVSNNDFNECVYYSVLQPIVASAKNASYAISFCNALDRMQQTCFQDVSLLLKDRVGLAEQKSYCVSASHSYQSECEKRG